MLENLKEVKEDIFDEFLENYEGKITVHQWDNITLYYDFNRPSKHTIHSYEMMCDCLIAKKVESIYFYLEEYFILK